MILFFFFHKKVLIFMASFAPTTSLFIILTLFPVTTHSLPFVVFHGLAESCTKNGVKQFTDLLSNWSDSQGYCIEIGNGAWDSWFMPFPEQTQIACDKVKSMSELSHGYNIVGLSQGTLVGRGVVEFCDAGPPVKNFISVSGPHAGQASIPFCGSGLLCIILESVMKLVVYTDIVQEHLAPANYIKIPTDIGGYKKGCKFLPKLNNEFEKNSTYKERFSSLQNLILIMCDQDSVLVPKETSWFGYYPDGAWEPILPPQQDSNMHFGVVWYNLAMHLGLMRAREPLCLQKETRLYIEDWIGLRTLDEAGKVKFVNVTGGHLDIFDDDIKSYIVPYLVDEWAPENPILTNSSQKRRIQKRLSSDAANTSIRKVFGRQNIHLNIRHHP